MNAQQIFDKVATHLIKQGKRAAIKDEYGKVCMYRAPDGCKCAAGCLIPDRLYRAGMERRGVIDLSESFELPKFFSQHLGLIANLQAVHDVRRPSRWRGALRRVAKLYGLNTDCI